MDPSNIIKGYFIFKFDEQFGFFSFLRYLHFITEIKIIHSFFKRLHYKTNPILILLRNSFDLEKHPWNIHENQDTRHLRKQIRDKTRGKD